MAGARGGEVEVHDVGVAEQHAAEGAAGDHVVVSGHGEAARGQSDLEHRLEVEGDRHEGDAGAPEGARVAGGAQGVDVADGQDEVVSRDVGLAQVVEEGRLRLEGAGVGAGRDRDLADLEAAVGELAPQALDEALVDLGGAHEGAEARLADERGQGAAAALDDAGAGAHVAGAARGGDPLPDGL